ncbi:uncharacterized protein LOC106158946 [Lingula anatina]|uniref:Uncharacterized protein LOC106158946 n=1 Tax=Lingula anatina TaxID=7574 RepID=A0A1S3HWX4_LINAN|nr:uncharacterized protein LOC106158946 [Lingula anatina]XP_013390530.1 uncharacterized protein LOC106158946 [Lingula anatina]|eukprot:XP_013390529.1 uncharacterized protein LOC106158946 [Lingula anatina]
MAVARIIVAVLCFLSVSRGHVEQGSNDAASHSDIILARQKRFIDVQTIGQHLGKLLNTKTVPDSVSGALGALDKVTQLLTCLPTRCTGNCCSSPSFCSIPQLQSKVIHNLRAKFTLCKNPWKVRIDLDAKFNLPWWAKLLKIKVNPIIIPIDSREKEGVIQIKSTTTLAKASLIGIGLGKAKLEFDLFLRYDCTKPRDNPSLRRKYNTMYTDGKPGPDGNKLFYKVDIKFKEYRKNFWCFCYKLKKTRALVAKKGHFAEGPKSCIRDSQSG